MRPETLRRLLVFGVCALAIGGLYFVPIPGVSSNLGGTGEPVEASRERQTAVSSPSGAAVRTSGSRGVLPASGAAAQGGPDSAPQDVPDARQSQVQPTPPGQAQNETQTRQSETRQSETGQSQTGQSETGQSETGQSETGQSQTGQSGTGQGRNEREPSSPSRATAYDPARVRDVTAPSAVGPVTLTAASHERLTLQWAPAQDNVGVTAYRVWLNGFEVATTQQTEVTVPWFNDDSSHQVVQVRALDAAGNQSEMAGGLLADRPSAEPSGTPAPGPTETPSPAPSATSVLDPTTSASQTPTAGESARAGNP